MPPVGDLYGLPLAILFDEPGLVGEQVLHGISMREDFQPTPDAINRIESTNDNSVLLIAINLMRFTHHNSVRAYSAAAAASGALSTGALFSN